MKRTLVTALAVFALAAPFAAAQPEYRDQQQGQYEGPRDGRDGRDARDGRDGQARDGREQARDGRDQARDDRGERRRHRQNWRDGRHDARWDDDRHNGYYSYDRWYYGPPPAGMSRRHVRLGYRQWSRGQRLGYYHSRYEEVDYRGERGLRRPPRGYHWVRDNEGDYLLAAIATGIILQVVLSNR